MQKWTHLRATSIGALILLAATGLGQEVPANVTAALKKADAGIAAILKIKPKDRNFWNTFASLDKISAQLDVDTSLTVFMQYVSTNAEERDSARAADEAVTNWAIALGKREDLYKALKAAAATKAKLSPEEQRLCDHWLRDFRRSGMGLDAAKRKQLQGIEEQLNKLGIDFQRNIAEDETKVALAPDELKGVPAEVLKRIPMTNGLYLVGMDTPTYSAIMDNCEVALTRQKCWLAHKRRGGLKNVQVLERLIPLRAQQAKMLNYKSPVDYEVEIRMARNSDTIAKFYEQLEPLVRQKRDADMVEFNEVKRKATGDPNAKLDVWDYAFYKNALLRDKYAVDQDKVAEYLPMEKVVAGLFSITSKLYNIEYRDITSKAAELKLPLWHEDVKLYEVVSMEDGKLLGRMYTDLYPRPAKYSHAACWGLRPRYYLNGKEQVPLAALVCNFTKPTAEKPSLLPHDEAETFFHEFGHGLHHILSQCRYARFSGTSVARDFVEAPSQMLENWVWDPAVLDTFAAHYQTGEKFPKALLDGMVRARTLGSGIETSFQLFLGEMDQAFHTVPDGKVDTVAKYKEVFGRLMPYAPINESMYHASFTHMVGYQGAYYGYLWSLVYAQDMFQRFEELGLLNPEAGKYYRNKILGRGGSMEEMDMLKDYLGREPKMDAFLKHLGLGG
ncbi:MAG: Zn-dependent oligopeptidase [Armatimonadetes bacterium]|nr:Zn-dependent oligopeptidase [Armatimonadota bacterium]